MINVALDFNFEDTHRTANKKLVNVTLPCVIGFHDNGSARISGGRP